MKNIFFISLFLTLVFTSCKDQKKPIAAPESDTTSTQVVNGTDGYKLMEQKCFVCHFPVPNPAKKDQMIAPPMLRIQEHYKPAYPNKEEFIAAIQSWVKEPTEEKIQMPGAARKFKIMPYMAYSDEEIRLIAETLFNVDFGASPKGELKQHNEKKKLQLNKGKKWKLSEQAIANVKGIINKLDQFHSKDLADYQDLGKQVFNTAKNLILDQNIEGEALDQVQIYFHNVENDIHLLMEAKTIEEAQDIKEKIQKRMSKFFDFFE